MDIQDLRKKLEETTDKYSIISDLNVLKEHGIKKYVEIFELAKEFLSDQEKVKLLEVNFMQNAKDQYKNDYINIINDYDSKIESLKILKIQGMYCPNVIMNLNSEDKINVLNDEKLCKEFGISESNKQKIFNSLDEEEKKDILTHNKDFIKNDLKFSDFDIAKMIANIDFEGQKNLINYYEVNNETQLEIILQSFPEENKKEVLLNDEYSLSGVCCAKIISSLGTKSALEFYKQNKEFCKEKNIDITDIANKLTEEEQIDLIYNIDEADLELYEKKKILIKSSSNVKEKIDSSKLSEDFQKALDMKLGIIDFNQDLEIYRGLDDLFSIMPQDMNQEDKNKINDLLEICPNIKINDKIGATYSSKEEFINGEKWIDSVLSGMDENWSDIQKVAYIDNQIGKKISYTPDFSKGICKNKTADARALWKIIDSGYGVCNGIAQVEKYILDQIGIQSEMISGVEHTFLKLKDIEIPTKDGMQKGNTILDPTWNLTAQRYGGYPDNFCVSYKSIREHDILSDGSDRECHKNDEILEDATLELDEENLRKIYSSIGAINKDGSFPIVELFNKIKEKDSLNTTTDKIVLEKLKAIQEYCPEFATCQNSTMAILQGALQEGNINFNRCMVNTVYNKNDENKEPVIYVYADLPDVGKKFYYADKENQCFKETEQLEFENMFECYEVDKKNGLKPWNDLSYKKEEQDLTTSSGKVSVEKGGEER